MDFFRKSFIKVCYYAVMSVAAFLLTGALVAESAYGLWFKHPNVHEVYETWNRVPARIKDYRVASRLGYHQLNRTSVHDRLIVRYHYVVNHRVYESENPGWYAVSDINALDKMSPGKRETVCYVNPANPTDAVLFCNVEDRPRWFARAVFLFFLTWFAVAIYALWLAWREFIRRLIRLPESCRRRTWALYEWARQKALYYEARLNERRRK